jgi:hypothetical protein
MGCTPNLCQQKKIRPGFSVILLHFLDLGMSVVRQWGSDFAGHGSCARQRNLVFQIYVRGVISLKWQHFEPLHFRQRCPCSSTDASPQAVNLFDHVAFIANCHARMDVAPMRTPVPYHKQNPRRQHRQHSSLDGEMNTAMRKGDCTNQICNRQREQGMTQPAPE